MLDPVRPSVASAPSVSRETGNGSRRNTVFVEHVIPTLIGLVAVGLITTIMMIFSAYFVSEHLIFFYLFPIAAIAMFYSSTPAFLTSIGSALGVAYFLFPPVFSLRIKEPLQIVELVIFCMLAFIASKAANRLLR